MSTGPVELAAIVGSLRRGSVNGAVARAAAGVATTARVTIHDVSDVPLYDGDVEKAGLPESVDRLNRAVGEAEGLLLFSPEYNSSLPAVTKNVIDWLSRPPMVWDGLPIGLVAATPGARAGAGVREHLTDVLARRPVRFFDTLGIGSYGEKLDPGGEVTDSETLDELADFVTRFATFCRDDAA